MTVKIGLIGSYSNAVDQNEETLVIPTGDLEKLSPDAQSVMAGEVFVGFSHGGANTETVVTTNQTKATAISSYDILFGVGNFPVI